MNTNKEPSAISQKLSFIAISLILVYIPLNCVIDLCLSVILGKGIAFLGAESNINIVIELELSFLFCLGLITAKLPLLMKFCVFIAMPIFYVLVGAFSKIAISFFQLKGVDL